MNFKNYLNEGDKNWSGKKYKLTWMHNGKELSQTFDSMRELNNHQDYLKGQMGKKVIKAERKNPYHKWDLEQPEHIHESSGGRVYKITWLHNEEEVSQTFKDITALVRQEQWLKAHNRKIVKVERKKPFGKYEEFPLDSSTT